MQRLSLLLLVSLTTAACGRDKRPATDDARAKAEKARLALVLDTVNIKAAAYTGRLSSTLYPVYTYPVEIHGDSAWVTTEKGPKGHSEVLVVRDTSGAWIRRGVNRRTIYPAAFAVHAEADDSLELYRLSLRWASAEDSAVGTVSLRDTSFERRFGPALGSRRDSTGIRMLGRRRRQGRALLLPPRITGDTATLQVLLQTPFAIRAFTRYYAVTFVRRGGRWFIAKAELSGLS